MVREACCEGWVDAVCSADVLPKAEDEDAGEDEVDAKAAGEEHGGDAEEAVKEEAEDDLSRRFPDVLEEAEDEDAGEDEVDAKAEGEDGAEEEKVKKRIFRCSSAGPRPRRSKGHQLLGSP